MFFITAKSIFQIFLMMLCGVIAYKTGILKKDGIPAINGVLLHLALPATLLRSFQLDILFDNKNILLSAFVLSAVGQIMCILLAILFIRKGEEKRIEQASIAFTNNAFIGLPLLSSIFGDIGTFYAAAMNGIACMFCFSVLPLMLCGSFSFKDVIGKVLNDKTNISIFAIILLLLDIHLPEIIMVPVGYLGSMTTPLAMISIGAVIASSDLKRMFNLNVLRVSFLRLVVTSLIIALIYKLTVRDNTMMLSYSILMAAPTGSLTTIYCEQYGLNTGYSSGIFVMTTLACAVTIPALVFLLGAF